MKRPRPGLSLSVLPSGHGYFWATDGCGKWIVRICTREEVIKINRALARLREHPKLEEGRGQ